MPISWFPGHMNKAKKELSKLAKDSDLILELLDARAPNASRNPLLHSIAPELPRIFILSKADLADTSTTNQWRDYLQQQTSTVCLVSSLENPVSAEKLLTASSQLLEKKTGSVQLIIAGIPNVGKSTFLNQLCGRKIAKTGNEPAITKGQQRIKLKENIYLIDTPGMMWPKLEDQEAAYKLAAIGTIRNTAVDAEDIAWFAAEYLLKQQFDALQQRYSISQDVNSAEELFESIAAVTGAKSKGGKANYHMVAETLLNDLRSGKLGHFSLESPPVS